MIMSNQAKPDGLDDISSIPMDTFLGSTQGSACEPKDTSTRIYEADCSKTNRYRFVTPAEWAILAHGVGGIVDPERQSPVHPAN